jgi:hypothetical protein
VFAGGVAAGFLIPVLPFALAGPSQFYRSLITAQVGYRAHAVRVGVLLRLKNILGLPYALGWPRSIVLLAMLVLVVFVIVTQAAGMVLTRRAPPLLDWFAAVSAALIVAMFLWPPQFHYHFTAFLAPFMALTLALPVSRLLGGADPDGGAAALPGAAAGRRLAAPAAAVAGGLLAVVAVAQLGFETQPPRVIGPIPAAIDRLIPPGACVLTDQVSVTLAANRFVSGLAGCPQIVDSLGTTLALSDGLKPQTGAAAVPAVDALWRQAFSHAQYVLLTATNIRRIAWTPQLQAYLANHFERVYQSPRRLTLYARTGLHAR